MPHDDIKIYKGLPKMIQAILMVVRLRTLPIPTIQILVGSGLGYVASNKFNWGLAFCLLAIATLITIGTNVINDYFDFEKGGDPHKRFGHRKVLRAGLMTKSQVYGCGMMAFALAIALSIPLAVNAGWVFFFLVVLSAVMGYGYTGGPFPICYLGLSELFIFIFYGGVCVISAFYVQTGFISGESVLCAVQMGLLAIIPAAINNFRDIYEDAEVNKITLAVRFGKRFARWEIAFITFMPYFLNLIWLFFGYTEAALMPLLSFPLAFLLVRSLWKTDPGTTFNKYFGLGVLVLVLFGSLLTAGFFLS